jgi:protein kinase/serine/threonine-protein kinase
MNAKLEAGTQFAGKYRLRERLGQGGFSIVWKAYDEHNNRDVVIKIGDWNSKNSDRLRSHFEKAFEAHEVIADNGGHPNVVSAYEGHIGDEIIYLVTEYIDGTSLDEAIHNGDITPGFETVFDIGKQICDAVSFLHQNGVCHLDIKPENILIQPDNIPILLDFNTAVCDHDTDTTLFYDDSFKPIEQTPDSWSSVPASKATDVYATGHVLAFLMTGTVHGDTDRTSNTVELDSDGLEYPSHVASYLRKATAKFPDSRFQSGQELLGGLQQCNTPNVPTATIEYADSNQQFSVEPGTIIGRSEGHADLVVVDQDKHISPAHARIEGYGTGWGLRDLSTNGTYVKVNDSWKYILSDDGYETLRESNRDIGTGTDRPPRRTELNDGALIRPVSKRYHVNLRFHLQN